MNFKEIIEKNYTGRTSFVGDNKVYFLQRDDIDKAVWSKIKTELKDNGFEISSSNASYDDDDDRRNYPYIEVKVKTNENKIGKMKKSAAKAFIKEQILSSLTEKKKGKKEDEEIEDITADDNEEETLPADDEISTGGVDPNIKTIQTALNKAVEAAASLGDTKLTTQLGNTITYFTRAHVSKTEVSEGYDVKDINKFRSLKKGDKVIYKGKENEYFKPGSEYEVTAVKSDSTFQYSITIKSGGKLMSIKNPNSIETTS